MRIGDVVERVQASQPAGADFSYLDLSAVDSVTKMILNARLVAAHDAPSRARQILRAGDVLVSTVRPNLNSVALVPKELDGAIASTGFTVLRANAEKADSRYLFHWVRTDRFIASMVRLATGASYPAVSDAVVKASVIPLPPLPEQRRIASILDQADELRRGSQSALALINEAQFSLFPIGWSFAERQTLRNLGLTFESGKSVTGIVERPGGGRVLKVSSVSNGRFDPAESKPLPDDYVPPSAHKVSTGDLLLTRASGSVDLIGVSAFVDDDREDLYLPDKLWRARLAPTSSLNLRFLHALFKHPEFRAYVRNAASGASGVRNISQAKVLDFSIAPPTASALHAFAEANEQADKVELALLNRLALQAELLTSLQHRAFNGEL